MKLVLLGLISLAGTLFAQTTTAPTFLQSLTTGLVSFSTNQNAQLNVVNLNPVAGTAGAAATICTVQLEFRDSSYALVKQLLVNNIAPGAAASLTLTRSEAGNLSTPRFGIRGMVRTNPNGGIGCSVATTLEIYNADTGNTQLVTNGTWPVNGFLPPILQGGR